MLLVDLISSRYKSFPGQILFSCNFMLSHPLRIVHPSVSLIVCEVLESNSSYYTAHHSIHHNTKWCFWSLWHINYVLAHSFWCCCCLKYPSLQILTVMFLFVKFCVVTPWLQKCCWLRPALSRQHVSQDFNILKCWFLWN
jgi:hypothetical protein